MELRVPSNVGAASKHPVAYRQITVLERRSAWTEEEARTHMVNKTSLVLRKVVRNTNNLYNPVRKWGDACWFYKWLDDPSL